MNFLDDPIKVVPEPPADSATSWRTGRGSQSKGGRTRVVQRMFPTKKHHLSMAAVLLTISVLLLIAASVLNYDLCVKYSSDLEVLGRYIQPSGHNSGFPQVIADFMASLLVLIGILCFYRWSSYPIVPSRIQKSIDHVNAEPPEMVQIMSATDSYLPETIFRPKSEDELQFMEATTFCFIGFGIFRWFKPVIFVIIGGFAVLCTVSVINLYQDYLHLKRNEKMPVAGIAEYADGQNSAILLNVRFSNLTETQNHNEGINQRPNGTELVYVPAVQELNSIDTRASDMKTV
ncbi:unnamed protein product [Nezara viridula]|uniref:Uncharacterized protein n=1 Tax=Nezara viridula TaxID=85310 RepID=A0A9P0HE90_NEZVI|nr:unnamed protein product [Nezara viridula]